MGEKNIITKNVSFQCFCDMQSTLYVKRKKKKNMFLCVLFCFVFIFLRTKALKRIQNTLYGETEQHDQKLVFYWETLPKTCFPA